VVVIIVVGAGKSLGCEGYFSRISPDFPEIFLCRKLSPYKLSVAVSYSLSTLKHEDFSFFFGGQKFFLEKKKSKSDFSDFYIVLFSQTH